MVEMGKVALLFEQLFTEVHKGLLKQGLYIQSKGNIKNRSDSLDID